MKPFPTDMFRFIPCLHCASRGWLSRVAPPIQPLELARQKAFSQYSDISQHSSIVSETQAGPGQFFHTAGAASWYQTKLTACNVTDMVLPTHTKLRPHSWHTRVLTRPGAWFFSANLGSFFHFTVFLWVAGILCVTLMASFSSCKFLHCYMSAEKQVRYSFLTSIFTTVIPFILLSIYWERRKWEKEKQLFGDNRKMPIWTSL